MTKNRRAHDEEAWTNAKKLCRLTARQVEMGRALGMNARELPCLRASPQEDWKLPVGVFIEACYWKRFGAPARTRGREPSARKPSRDTDASDRVRNPAWQLSDLACYCTNLADDLQKWLVHGSIDAGVLAQVRDELWEIAIALDIGAPISPMPEIPLPPRPRRRGLSRQRDREPIFDDDEIPF